MLLFRSRSVTLSSATRIAAGKRLLDAVDRGTFQLTSPADLDLYLEFLEAEGPTEASLKQLQKLMNGAGETRTRAHSLVRRFGPKASSLADTLWPKILDEKSKPEDRARAAGHAHPDRAPARVGALAEVAERSKIPESGPNWFARGGRSRAIRKWSAC